MHSNKYMNKNSRLVYSTEEGRVCPDCSKAKAACICRQPSTLPTGDGIIRIQRETKGRKGKGVSLITGLQLDDKQLHALAKQLKKRCGCGGTVKAGIIEIQGDYRELLQKILEKMGHNVKIAGG